MINYTLDEPPFVIIGDRSWDRYRNEEDQKGKKIIKEKKKTEGKTMTKKSEKERGIRRGRSVKIKRIKTRERISSYIPGAIGSSSDSTPFLAAPLVSIRLTAIKKSRLSFRGVSGVGRSVQDGRGWHTKIYLSLPNFFN